MFCASLPHRRRLTYKADGAEQVRKAVQDAAKAVKLAWKETNTLVLRRGPYVIADGLDESVPDAKPFTLRGHYLNLFDPSLEVHGDVLVPAGARMLLLDLANVHGTSPRVIAAACRVRNERSDGKALEFQVDGIADTNSVLAIAAHAAPTGVTLAGKPLETSQYDYSQGVLRLRFPNTVEPATVAVTFAK